MAGNLGTAVIEFSADTAKFVGDIGKASATFNRSMARMEAGVANLRNAFVTLAAAGGVGAMVKSAIDAGDQLNKLSQKIGISVESLSELKLGAQLADVDLEGLTTGLKKFNVALAEAKNDTSKQAEIFRQLGVDITRGPEAALRQFADSMSKLADGETKTAIATELMGRAGINMIPWLNAGAAGMDKAAASARALGLTISTDFAAKAEQFNDNMKLLGKRAEALGIAIGEHLLGGLSSFTGKLVEAAEKGELLSGVLREIIKLDLALFSKLPGPLGAMADAAATRMFADSEKRSGRSAGASGSWGEPDAPPKPNPDAVACAVSGGKWVNGKCVRAGAAVAKAKDDAEMIARLQLEGEEEFQKQVTEAWTLTGEARAREIARLRETESQNLRAMFAMIDAEQDQAIEQTQLYLEALGKDAKEDERIFRELGLTFSSALGELITSGGTASDVLRAMAKDVAQLIAKIVLLEPLAENLRKIFKGMSGGSSGGVSSLFSRLFGGSSTGASAAFNNVEGNTLGSYLGPYAEGTSYVPRTGLALLHQGEAVIPAAENAAGGRGGTYYIDARGADAAKIGQLERMIQGLNGTVERRAVAAVAAQRLRGGSFAQVFA